VDLNTPEIQRLVLSIGSCCALAYKDRFGIIPGGIVVPGFLLILLLLSPLWAMAVVLLSFIIYFIYRNWLDRVDYKRRTQMYILATLSVLLSYPAALAYIAAGILPASIDSLSGTLLPGVIALNLNRQGVTPVGRAIVISTLVTACLAAIIIVIGAIVFRLDFDTLRPYYTSHSLVRFHGRVLLFLISLVAGFLIYQRTNFRAGGYMVAPIAAALLLQPLSALMFGIGCILVYILIVQLARCSLIIGLKRYVLALLYSMAYVWGVEIAFIHFGLTSLPFQGNHLFVIIAMMSYANDCILYGARRVLPWMILLLLVVVVALLITRSIVASWA